MRIMLGLSLVLAGCGLLGQATKSAKPAEGCPTNADDRDANMSCIVNTDGTSDHIGETFSFTCPAFEVSRFIFVNGGDPFAAQTKICWAAAYAGKLDPTTGGPVKIKILAAQTEYPAGEKKNGIKSQSSKAAKGIVGYTFVE